MNLKARQPREFQVFAKPVGPLCNMECAYCYYLEKEQLFSPGFQMKMPEILLEEYMVQHLEASTEAEIHFSWHGGEPTLAGLDFFRKVVALQRKIIPKGRLAINGIQTNGTLLDQDWCKFLKEENFRVGLSMDGPREFHDRYRVNKNGKSMFDRTIQGLFQLLHHGIQPEILCVVNAHNVHYPLELYRFFKQFQVKYVTFLPLVENIQGTDAVAGNRSVPAELFGDFLSTVFDEWKEQDIGKIKVQVFEEALRTAFNQDHTLCIFKQRCGGVPVIEHNGDVYSCDHFVTPDHFLGNILEHPIAEMLDSQQQQSFGQAKQDNLPAFCLQCEVLDMCNGECPKNRFIHTPEGEPGLNYLCAGYRKFFNHCKPFVQEVAARWKEEES
jgi:uncharacterized protein